MFEVSKYVSHPSRPTPPVCTAFLPKLPAPQPFSLPNPPPRPQKNAFRALNGDMGEDRARHDGVGILVSEESKETNAAYTLRNPDEVASFLEKIAELGRERCRNSGGGTPAR